MPSCERVKYLSQMLISKSIALLKWSEKAPSERSKKYFPETFKIEMKEAQQLFQDVIVTCSCLGGKHRHPYDTPIVTMRSVHARAWWGSSRASTRTREVTRVQWAIHPSLTFSKKAFPLDVRDACGNIHLDPVFHSVSTCWTAAPTLLELPNLPLPRVFSRAPSPALPLRKGPTLFQEQADILLSPSLTRENPQTRWAHFSIYVMLKLNWRQLWMISMFWFFMGQTTWFLNLFYVIICHIV